MTAVSDFQDIKALIDNLYENNSEVLNESLQRLILVLQSSQKEDIIYHLESLFEKFPILLLDENLSVIVQTSQLLIELITQLAKETEQYFTLVLENLIMNLADSKPVIRKMAFNSLSSFIQMTKNYDLVYTGLIQYGILHANPQTRQKCINAINNFMLSDSSCITTSPAFRKVIEKLIEKSNESIDSVRSSVYQVITNLNSHHKAAFSSLVKKLSYSDQEKIRIMIENPDSINMESQESTPVNNNNNTTISKSPLRPYDMKQETEKSTTPRKNSDTTDSPNRVPKNFKMTTKKTSFAPLQTGKQLLRFGLFEHRVIDDASVQDWRTRLAATEDILKTVEGLDSTHVIVPYLGEFFDMLVLLLNDVNFKICINSLNIIGITFKLTSKDDLSPHLSNVVSVLLGKLGDSKVAVRQIAFQILAGAAKKMDTQELLSMVFTRLKENNWHMREECLLLIQMVFNSSTEELSMSFYEETVENMIETLDDQKPKVRNTARETIVNVLRHYSQPMQLLNTIQPLLEKELYEYMLFRIQNPENFPRNNYTPYTEDSSMEPRDVLGMTGMTANTANVSDHDYRASANAHFRSMTTSPRDPNMINMAPNPNLRHHNSDNISSASPYRRHNNYDPNHSQIANTTGYSNSSSNTYFNNTGENSRYGNRNVNMGTPYDKRHYDGDSSPVISNFGTPYTKNSVHTPESQQRLGNSYNNQSGGYYPKVHTPYQGQKGLYEISTASSSRSTYSRNNNNTIYSFEASSISNSSGIEKAKFAKQNPMSYTNMLDSRINSAQVNTDLSPGVYGRDKRTYSATEEQNKSGLQNKLSAKKTAVPGPGSDTYLEYSITKKLDDFISNNFDGQGTLDQQFPKVRQGEVFSSIDSFQTTDSQSYNQLKQGNSANPYRGTRPDLAQKLKKLQSQQPPIILEADETKRTTKKETSDTTNDRLKDKKPPLPLHKRGVSQNNRNDFAEKDNESDSDDDNSFSIKNNAPSKTLKKKATAKTAEVLTIPDYKKLDYLTKDQLEPIEGNLDGAIKTMNNELKTDDWQKQFEASNNLRRLLQFHCSHLVNSAMFNLHSTTQDILRMVESLRSNLAKNGLITLTEMCGVLKRQMDSESDMIYAKLIKKGSDANSFISEEVKRALYAVSQNCSDTKVIPILLSMFQQKAIPAKINIALCCEAVITKNENRVNQLRDFDKIVIILGNYILDSANEVRNASKQAMSTLVSFLFSKSELDKILQRQFTEGNLNRINAIISKELSQGNSTLMITNLQATGKNKSAPVKPKVITSKTSFDDEEEKVESKPMMRTREYARESTDSKESPLLATSEKPKKAIKAGARDPKDYEDLQGIFSQADATDWKTRFEAGNALADFGKKHCDTLPRSKLVHKYMDYFTKLMQDSNTKVSSSAISSFIDMIPELKPSIESNITTVSNASLALLGSVNPSIKNAAENLFENLSDCIDPSILIPSWTNSLPFTNVKAKIAILSKLNEIASGLYSKKPNLITKNVIPVISKCIEETKAEIRNATHQLFQTLYSFMNRDLLDYVPANKAQIVFDIVAGKCQ